MVKIISNYTGIILKTRDEMKKSLNNIIDQDFVSITYSNLVVVVIIFKHV